MKSVAPAEKLRNASPVLLFFVALTIAAIIAQTWWAVVQDRTLTLESERGNGLIAVRLLEEHATQTMMDAERKLNTIASTIHATIVSGESNTDELALRKVITEGLQDNRFLTALQFINLKKESWVTSLDYPAHQIDTQDRPYFDYLLTHPDIRKAIIGRPFQRFYDNRLVLPMALNLYDMSGKHIGVISTDISVPYFADVYARVAKNSRAIVSLFANDGFVIVRSPFDAHYVALDISRSPVLARLKQSPVEGSFEDTTFLNDKEPKKRLYTYHKMSSFPITTVFGRDFDSILLAWTQRTQDRVLFSGATIALIALLTFFLLQHIRRLHQSEYSLRNSEAKFVSLFQRSPVPLALLSINKDRYIEVNDALLQQSGFQRNDIIGKTAQEVQLWADMADRQPYLDLLQRQRYVDRYEIRTRHKDGHVVTCLLSSRIVESGGEPMILFSPIDVTRQREIENEIRELNIQLEQRVRQRTINLEEANHELGSALSSLKNMQGELLRSEKMAALGGLVAGVAHELNTPIGNSVTVASTLQENAEFMLNEIRSGKPRRALLDQSLEASSRGAEILVRNLHRAAELVSSFKQVAVDQSSNHRREFDLRQVLEEVVLTLETMYKKTPYTLHLNLAENITLESYPGPLGQIITNFVSNALAHAFEGRSHGTMTLATRKVENDQAEITFSDDGIGIKPEFIARVFDPFFTTKLGQGGSGLGMHIVYNLVTGVLGGKITLDSKPGEGTTLTLVLPMLAPDGGDGTVT
jgi:PAS domain S-box-containing protein